jgi:serpin B
MDLRSLAPSALIFITIACTTNDPSAETGETAETGDTGETGDEPTWPMAESALPRDESPQPTADEMQALAADNHALTLDLYHELREGDALDAGFTLSAYSIQSAFGMLYGGTVEPAATEMATTLHFSLPDERQHIALNSLDLLLRSRNLPDAPEQDGVILQTANGVWAQEELGSMIYPEYLDLLALHYGTGVALADFVDDSEQERLDINLWVSNRTHMLIPELFKPGMIHSEITMVLVNALYLKASWNQPFESASTAPGDFTRLDASVVQVDMMSKYDLAASYGEGAGYRALGIPLYGGQLELVAIVPDDFSTFEAALDTATLDAALASMQYTIVTAEIPRFELELDTTLKAELQALGLVTPFEDPSSFEGIMPGGPGVISDVIHHTVMTIDEKGVEAAAATGILVDEGGGNEPEFVITVDRPFLVMIRDVPTGTLLFFGRVLDPSA